MAKSLTDIKYTEAAPSGRPSNVPLNMNVSTGAEHIAQGMAALGGAFERIGEAKNAVELSTMKRQFDEASFAAFNTYSQTGDEEGRKAIVEKWSKDVEKIQSKSARVNQEFQIHKNNALPEWGNSFAKTELGIQHKQTVESANINIQKAMENNDIGGAAKDIMNLANKNIISQADAGQKIKDLPYESKIVQANKAVYDNPEAAQELLKIENFQGADVGILKQRDQMQDLATEQLNQFGVQFDNNINEQMNKIDQQPNLSEVQLRDSAAQLDKQIDASKIGGKRKMQLHKEVRSWIKDEGNMDFPRIRSLEDRIERVKAYGVNDPELIPDINRARLEGALGSRKEGSGKEANRMIRAATSAKVNISIAATRQVQSDFATSVKKYPNNLELEHLLHKDILDALDEHPEWNDTQAMSFAAQRAKVYENLNEKQSGTLIEMRERGQRYLGWQDLPPAAQKKDLESLRNVKVPSWPLARSKTALSGDWTKADVQKAQEIIGGKKEITPDMTKQFSDYLSEQGKAHFEQIGLPRVTTKEQFDALPSGAIYINRQGQRVQK